MAELIDELLALCDGVDQQAVRTHVERLSERYFATFDLQTVSEHVSRLALVRPDEPVDVLINPLPHGAVGCTVLSYDYPGVFSLICGVLSSHGLEITSGDVFTYARRGAPPSSTRRFRRHPRDASSRRRIVDYFVGDLPAGIEIPEWGLGVRQSLSDVLLVIEGGGGDGPDNARGMVNEMVARALRSENMAGRGLYPVQIRISNDSPELTEMAVEAEDTPFFLYALSTALSLSRVAIEQVRIRTEGKTIHDLFGIADARGRRITDSSSLDRIKLSVLLTKQFTYFLTGAPDPYAALRRFEQMVEQIPLIPEQQRWYDYLSRATVLRDLARLLGASDFLWEEFIRLHHETLLPILIPAGVPDVVLQETGEVEGRLREIVDGPDSFDAKVDRLNELKDREIFSYDMHHILHPRDAQRVLSRKLTALAEHVVRAALRLCFERLVQRRGTPRTVAGLEARYALLGLGKLGGEALGYASDIELLLVYGDNGQTDGSKPVPNAEFYSSLIREVSQIIRAKREGIFTVDLRLRPYGAAGPDACSLESFCRYYAKEGPAHSFERLALVRLRAIGGDPELGARIERLRDEMIYVWGSIDLEQLRELRRRQVREKGAAVVLNAKFSPGALVDLEYTVQILQIEYGRDDPGLRTPRTRDALEALTRAGVLEEQEAKRLESAYAFLRKLINGLRMLRGSALDLFLPTMNSPEYLHLARRMDYEGDRPVQQLHLDFQTQTAEIRSFMQRHFGDRSLLTEGVGNVVDLVLMDDVAPELATKVLTLAGFRDPERSYRCLRGLAGGAEQKQSFARLAVLATDMLVNKPDPDMALNNWERFMASRASAGKDYEELLSQPTRLEILLSMFASSQFLTDTLIRNPSFFAWLTDPRIVASRRRRSEMRTDLDGFLDGAPDHAARMGAVRLFRRREIALIGFRDICLGAPLEEICLEISELAETLVDAVLNEVFPGGDRRYLALCAVGKLGGRELNYSSDIDLLAVCDPGFLARDDGHRLARAVEALKRDLEGHSRQGSAYRVDFRLRPYGRSGELVQSTDAVVEYYANRAALWELQALLKLRWVAGNASVGQGFVTSAHEVLLGRLGDLGPRDERRRIVLGALSEQRERSVRRSSRLGCGVNVKTGPGGIRDIEFLVQGVQMLYCVDDPELLEGNTLRALELIRGKGLLDPRACTGLAEDYSFLRRVEHFLQIYDDRQVHALPTEPRRLESLAKGVLAGTPDADTLLRRVQDISKRVAEAFAALVHLA